MALKAATRRPERFSETPTCKYWLAGRCNRNPCRFLHRLPSPSNHYYPNANTPYTKYIRKPQSSIEKTIKQESKAVKPHSSPDKATKHDAMEVSNKETATKYDAKEISNKETGGRSYVITFGEAKPSTRSICKYWMNDNCVHGDQCQNLHSWSYGDRISTIAKLHEHKKVITGIALPVGSDKLYSGSTDGTLCTWDCHTGCCINMINLGSEISSLICEGPWIFAGVKNAVKAWNFQTAAEFTLDGPKGQVLSMIVGNETLFAAADDGVIYAWRGSSDPEAKCSFELVASLCGHTKAITCLTVGLDYLYSGSMDRTIKMWGLDTLNCKMTLGGHPTTVTSLICWADYLLSSSDDGTLKFWEMTADGSLKVAYTHIEKNGILALSGMNESQGKHILLVSCKDNSVRMYELPLFSEMGLLFTRREVRSFEMGPDGLFFTGDSSGLLTVWKWLDEAKVPSS